MADPILGLDELLEGDSRGYLRQNDRNLVMARLAAVPIVINNNQTYPAAAVARGDMYIIPASATGLWTGKAAKTIAIALAADPAVAAGWFYLTPAKGIRLWIVAGTVTDAHVVYDGANYVAV